MLCLKPYKEGVQEYGCGQCLPCRLNRKRLWTARLLLEQRVHDLSWFVTLTYTDEFLPSNGSVCPRELQLFLKRLRERIPERVRYYGVGEYGDVTSRPHYHLALFGLGDHGHVNPGDADVYGLEPCACPTCDAWGKGGVVFGDLTPQSAAYIVSYVTKRLTRRGDERLGGRHPEFARMSLRPGIGAPAVPVLEQALTTDVGAKSLLDTGDVPSAVRHEAKLWPLGRYLRRKLREEIGMDSGEPAALGERRARELQAVLREQGQRALREEKRVQVGRRSAVLDSISRTKKGVGAL